MNRISQIVLLIVASICSISALASPVVLKLRGPVTGFIEKAQVEYMDFDGATGKRVGYLHWKASRKGQPPLVIVPGRGEIAYLWAETAYDLRELGFGGDIFVWDPPGQGLSDRMLASMTNVGHIERFADYVKNLQVFLDSVRTKSGFAPHVIGHSMGATISVLALRQKPELAKDVFLAAPMFGVGVVGPLYPVFSAVTNVLDWFPFMRQLSVNRSSGFFVPPAIDNSLTERLRFRADLKTRYNGYTPGKTIHWLAEANRAIQEALNPLHKTALSTMVVVAGQDEIVRVPTVDILKQQFLSDLHFETIAGARHSMHEEGDGPRSQFLRLLSNWLKLPGISNPQILSRLLLDRS